MSNYQAILFDADGVLTRPKELFFNIYARYRGLDPAPFQDFFNEQFPAARVGQADLKTLLLANNDLWQWQGEIDDLLTLWFESENKRNEPLLELVHTIRASGIPCFIATNQEKHRAMYFKNIAFKQEFDDYFFSADLGFEKPELQFFEHIIDHLQKQWGVTYPNSIAIVDDSFINIEAAKQTGLTAFKYKTVKQIQEVLGI